MKITTPTTRQKRDAYRALKSTLGSLKRTNLAYDQGDYDCARDLSVFVARALHDELVILGVRKKANFADLTAESFPPVFGRLLTSYSPFCGITVVEPQAGTFKFENPWSSTDLESPAILEDGSWISEIEERVSLAVGQPITGYLVPRLTWKKYEDWRRQLIFWEADGPWSQRVAAGMGKPERRTLRREDIISIVRNGSGAHFDRNLSEEMLAADMADSGLRPVFEKQQPFAVNTPSGSMLRAISDELCLTVSKILSEFLEP